MKFGSQSSRTGVSLQLNRNQKKGMLIFLLILLGIMLMMLINWEEAYIL